MASYRGQFLAITTDPILVGYAADIGTTVTYRSGSTIYGTYFKYGAANTAWINLSNGPLVTPETIYKTRAMARLGITDPTLMQSIYNQGTPHGKMYQSLLAGTTTTAADSVSNSWLVQSGATSGSFGSSYSTTLGTTPLLFRSAWDTTGVFYFATRFKCTTAVTAQTILSAISGNTQAGEFLILGVHGATSSTKYVLKFNTNAAALTSTVSIDTSYHIAEGWRPVSPGNLTYLSVDGELRFRANAYSDNANWTGDFSPYAANGSDSVNRGIAVNWCLYCTNAP
jgi:hypothetical protein